MPSQRPFLSNLFAALRAHHALKTGTAASSSTAPSSSAANFSSASASSAAAAAAAASSGTSPRAIATAKSSSQIAAAASAAFSSSASAANARVASTSPPSPGLMASSPPTGPGRPMACSPTAAAFGGAGRGGPSTMGGHRHRRGSDSSSDNGLGGINGPGFRDAMGGEKWFIGGRTAGGEERFYRLGMVKRERSGDRTSCDRMSL